MTLSARQIAVLPILATLLLAAGCGGAAERKERYLQRGQEYFDAKNYDKARVEYSNALQIDPKNAAARYNLGRIAEQQGSQTKHWATTRRRSMPIPVDIRSRAALARIYILGGLPAKASEILEPRLQAGTGRFEAADGSRCSPQDDRRQRRRTRRR